MAEEEKKAEAPLAEYFRAVDKDDAWELWCKHPGCKAGWAVLKSHADKPGNLLHLLNHAKSHEAKGRRRG